jgi:hypothetical protein
VLRGRCRRLIPAAQEAIRISPQRPPNVSGWQADYDSEWCGWILVESRVDARPAIRGQTSPPRQRRVVNEVLLNQMLVRVGDEETTNRIERWVQVEGTLWPGATTWRGERLLRIAVSNWRRPRRTLTVAWKRSPVRAPPCSGGNRNRRDKAVSRPGD